MLVLTSIAGMFDCLEILVWGRTLKNKLWLGVLSPACIGVCYVACVFTASCVYKANAGLFGIAGDRFYTAGRILHWGQGSR